MQGNNQFHPNTSGPPGNYSQTYPHGAFSTEYASSVRQMYPGYAVPPQYGPRATHHSIPPHLPHAQMITMMPSARMYQYMPQNIEVPAHNPSAVTLHKGLTPPYTPSAIVMTTQQSVPPVDDAINSTPSSSLTPDIPLTSSSLQRPQSAGEVPSQAPKRVPRKRPRSASLSTSQKRDTHAKRMALQAPPSSVLTSVNEHNSPPPSVKQLSDETPTTFVVPNQVATLKTNSTAGTQDSPPVIFSTLRHHATYSTAPSPATSFFSGESNTPVSQPPQQTVAPESVPNSNLTTEDSQPPSVVSPNSSPKEPPQPLPDVWETEQAKESEITEAIVNDPDLFPDQLMKELLEVPALADNEPPPADGNIVLQDGDVKPFKSEDRVSDFNNLAATDLLLHDLSDLVTDEELPSFSLPQSNDDNVACNHKEVPKNEESYSDKGIESLQDSVQASEAPPGEDIKSEDEKVEDPAVPSIPTPPVSVAPVTKKYFSVQEYLQSLQVCDVIMVLEEVRPFQYHTKVMQSFVKLYLKPLLRYFNGGKEMSSSFGCDPLTNLYSLHTFKAYQSPLVFTSREGNNNNIPYWASQDILNFADSNIHQLTAQLKHLKSFSHLYTPGIKLNLSQLLQHLMKVVEKHRSYRQVGSTDSLARHKVHLLLVTLSECAEAGADQVDETIWREWEKANVHTSLFNPRTLQPHEAALMQRVCRPSVASSQFISSFWGTVWLAPDLPMALDNEHGLYQVVLQPPVPMENQQQVHAFPRPTGLNEDITPTNTERRPFPPAMPPLPTPNLAVPLSSPYSCGTTNPGSVPMGPASHMSPYAFSGPPPSQPQQQGIASSPSMMNHALIQRQHSNPSSVPSTSHLASGQPTGQAHLLPPPSPSQVPVQNHILISGQPLPLPPSSSAVMTPQGMIPRRPGPPMTAQVLWEGLVAFQTGEVQLPLRIFSSASISSSNLGLPGSFSSGAACLVFQVHRQQGLMDMLNPPASASTGNNPPSVHRLPVVLFDMPVFSSNPHAPVNNSSINFLRHIFSTAPVLQSASQLWQTQGQQQSLHSSFYTLGILCSKQSAAHLFNAFLQNSHQPGQQPPVDLSSMANLLGNELFMALIMVQMENRVMAMYHSNQSGFLHELLLALQSGFAPKMSAPVQPPTSMMQRPVGPTQQQSQQPPQGPPVPQQMQQGMSPNTPSVVASRMAYFSVQQQQHAVAMGGVTGGMMAMSGGPRGPYMMGYSGIPPSSQAMFVGHQGQGMGSMGPRGFIPHGAGADGGNQMMQQAQQQAMAAQRMSVEFGAQQQQQAMLHRGYHPGEVPAPYHPPPPQTPSSQNNMQPGGQAPHF